MHYLLDSNILLYAKMDGMPEYPVVSQWLSETMSVSANELLITETAILSFLRISTNKRLFDPILGFDEARTYIERFLAHPATQLFRPSLQHFADVAEFMKKHHFRGNDAMDAHLAVIALTTGATLVTRDTDFKKIPYLKILDPLT